MAVAPYSHGINYKMQAYDAWVKVGGETMKGHYPWRPFHRFAFGYELPTIRKSWKIAQLRFVEPVSLSFDTFPDYARYEIIPLVWDCWPRYFEKTCEWFRRHDVRTAIFTSSQNAERMRQRFPQVDILTITEGIDTALYGAGKSLKNRDIDLLEFGRENHLFSKGLPSSVTHLHSHGRLKMFSSDQKFHETLENAKMTVCVPRCDTNPKMAGDIETLTQRYWEAMLSRMVIIGRAPQELIDLVGYNPVIEISREHAEEEVESILRHIEDYQDLVDKNRKVALEMGDWTLRIKEMQTFLEEHEYICR